MGISFLKLQKQLANFPGTIYHSSEKKACLQSHSVIAATKQNLTTKYGKFNGAQVLRSAGMVGWWDFHVKSSDALTLEHVRTLAKGCTKWVRWTREMSTKKNVYIYIYTCHTVIHILCVFITIYRYTLIFGGELFNVSYVSYQNHVRRQIWFNNLDWANYNV